MSNLTRTALAIDEDLLARFDAWMSDHGYTNRSEAVRDLIRSALVEQEWSDPAAAVAAVLSIIYDHSASHLAQEVTHIQHEDHHAVLCSQHVHLDHHKCLEVILMRGKVAQLRRVADTIIATRGVHASKLSLLGLDL